MFSMFSVEIGLCDAVNMEKRNTLAERAMEQPQKQLSRCQNEMHSKCRAGAYKRIAICELCAICVAMLLVQRVVSLGRT